MGNYDRSQRVLTMRAERLVQLNNLRAPKYVLVNEVALLMRCFGPKWMSDLWRWYAHRRIERIGRG